VPVVVADEVVLVEVDELLVLDEVVELDVVDAEELVTEVLVEDVVVVDEVDPLGLQALSWSAPPLIPNVEQTSPFGHA
jgi:hypothetical protein